MSTATLPRQSELSEVVEQFLPQTDTTNLKPLLCYIYQRHTKISFAKTSVL
jgi:hypothetical protein